MENPLAPERMFNPYNRIEVCEYVFQRAYEALSGGEDSVLVVGDQEWIGVTSHQGREVYLGRPTIGNFFSRDLAFLVDQQMPGAEDDEAISRHLAVVNNEPSKFYLADDSYQPLEALSRVEDDRLAKQLKYGSLMSAGDLELRLRTT